MAVCFAGEGGVTGLVGECFKRVYFDLGAAAAGQRALYAAGNDLEARANTVQGYYTTALLTHMVPTSKLTTTL